MRDYNGGCLYLYIVRLVKIDFYVSFDMLEKLKLFFYNYILNIFVCNFY